MKRLLAAVLILVGFAAVAPHVAPSRAPAPIEAVFAPKAQAAAIFRGATLKLVAPSLCSKKMLAVTDGDSLTQATNNGIRAYSNLYDQLKSGTDFTLQNSGHAGDVLSSVVAREASNTAYIAANPGKDIYAYTVFIVANNEGDASYYPDDAEADLLVSDTSAHLDRMRSNGFTKIAVGTMPDNGNDFSNTRGRWTARVNNGLRALVGSGHADAVLDFAGTRLGLLGANANPRWFSDALHTINLSQVMEELEYGSVINGFSCISQPPGAPVSIVAAQILQTQITLEWPVGQTGGLYTDFVLTYQASGGSPTTWTHQAGSRQTVASVTGLAPNTAYTFSLSFVGPAGTSSATSVTATTEATVASAFDINRSTTSLISPFPIVTLSAGNTIATRASSGIPAAFGAVAVVSRGRSSGKYHFEWRVNSSTATETFGLCDASAISNTAGAFANSVIGGSGPSSLVGFTSVNAINLAAWAQDAIGMIEVDFDAKTARLGKNGTWGASGANWISWSADYTLYPCFNLNFAGNSIEYKGSTFSYTPTAGFSAWD